MARIKSYYTLDEITNDLYTFGKEFMTVDNTEYVGPYHRYVTGETYTQFNWNPKTSVRLVKYQDLTQPTMRYRKIKNFNLPSILPAQIPCTINGKDIKRGYVTRYFISKINESTIQEIDLTQYEDWQQGRIDTILYVAITIDWAISGPLQDTITNGVTIPGVITRNRKAAATATATIPTIQTLLSNLTEFYTDSDFIVPKDINDLDS